MKAITVRQPWAALLAAGVKTIETRSWRTEYRGALAIHAAKGWTVAEMRYTLDLMARRVLPFRHLRDMPRGAIVATFELVECVPAETLWPDEFGDFTPGRWAWVLAELEVIEPPILVRGRQGLWTWRPE